MSAPIIKPDKFFNAVEQLCPDELAMAGIRYVLLDVDNTIVARGSTDIAPAAAAWIAALQQQGISICLVSNNWHRAVTNYAAELGLPIIYRAMKPLPVAFLKAKHMIGAKARQTLVVGDQLMTDIIGGKFLGIHTALVRPLVTQDLWHTLLLRGVEQRLLGDLKPEDERQ